MQDVSKSILDIGNYYMCIERNKSSNSKYFEKFNRYYHHLLLKNKLNEYQCKIAKLSNHLSWILNNSDSNDKFSDNSNVNGNNIESSSILHNFSK